MSTNTLVECTSAKKYKGIHPPRCNNHIGCDTCNRIYKEKNSGTTELRRTQ